MLPDLHTGFWRGRSGGLVFPSLSEFSTLYCDPRVKGFGVVNKAEIDVFLELSCFFHDPADAGNLISGSSAFSKTSLNIWKFMVHVLLKLAMVLFKTCPEMWPKKRLFCFLPNIHLYNRQEDMGIVLVVVTYCTEYTLNIFLLSRMFLWPLFNSLDWIWK